jgi:multisubunit Na+/H+ antiporter MnhB subunit
MRSWKIVKLICFFAFAVCLLWSMALLPEFGEHPIDVSLHYLEYGLAETTATNLVMAIVVGYRSLDTLGEATVLFTAAVGVITLLASRREK